MNNCETTLHAKWIQDTHTNSCRKKNDALSRPHCMLQIKYQYRHIQPKMMIPSQLDQISKEMRLIFLLCVSIFVPNRPNNSQLHRLKTDGILGSKHVNSFVRMCFRQKSSHVRLFGRSNSQTHWCSLGRKLKDVECRYMTFDILTFSS